MAVVCFKEEDLPATGEVDITNAGNILVDEVLTIGKNDSSSGLLIPMQFILWVESMNHLEINYFLILEKIQCNCLMI